MESGKWNQLVQSANFDAAAHKVFSRIIKNEWPGLIMLWGGTPGEVQKANKSYFLDMIETVQKKPVEAKPFVSSDLCELLKWLDPDDYHCIRVIESSNLPAETLYQTPLSVVLSVAISNAINRNGWVAMRKVVILCDNIQSFMLYNKEENEQFLRSLANALDKQTATTFIGASRMTGWDAEGVLGSTRLANLGWD